LKQIESLAQEVMGASGSSNSTCFAYIYQTFRLASHHGLIGLAKFRIARNQ